MITLIESAPAKINFWLSVGAKRADGFHEIETVMHTVSLADTVRVSVGEGSGISLTVAGNPSVPSDESNLAVRAAQLFLTRAGQSCKVQIHLEKRIPMAGGLAGGSADAAAVLRALNKSFHGYYSLAELAGLAAELGSDIPFCVYGGLALCRGRGEILTPLSSGRKYSFLIANAGEKVSTAAAYAALDSCPVKRGADRSSAGCLGALEQGDFTALAQSLYNRFEEYVLPICPGAAGMRAALREQGGSALMSGSGPSVFGVFESKAAALSAQKKLSFETVYAESLFPEYDFR